MALPLAYFLTWTCYGQRLHGDQRGSVDDAHNKRGTPCLKTNPQRQAREQSQMTQETVVLNPAMRQVADDAVSGICAEKEWRLLAKSVRSTHIHVVVNCRGLLSPERAMSQLKARITRDLRRAGHVAEDRRVWSHHGSTRWINFHEGSVGAIAYVEEWQTGPKKALLEEHKRLIRERTDGLREWLIANGLPSDGRGVVVE